MSIIRVTRDKLRKIIKKFHREGGSLVGFYNATYTEMVKKFGKPETGGSLDGKVSTTWSFVDDKSGSYIKFYDYKETSLYATELPSVKNFRLAYTNRKFMWHVGTNDRLFAVSWFAVNKLSKLRLLSGTGWGIS